VAAPLLQGQPIWQYVGAEDASWVAAFPVLTEVFCDGDAGLPDPAADRTDVSTRWMRTTSEDLVGGVRYLPPETPKHTVKLLPRDDRVATRVTVPLGYEPAQAWLFDLQAGKLTTLAWRAAGAEVSFTTDSSWFAALFRRRPGPVPCWVDLPGRMEAGETAEVTVTAPGLAEPVLATLRVPGLEAVEPRRVQVPGTFGLRLPAGSPPAWYRAEFTGPGLCPTTALFRLWPAGRASADLVPGGGRRV
jgi:hypothetical protein